MVYPEDIGFHAALSFLVSSAKSPIVLTCNEVIGCLLFVVDAIFWVVLFLF